MSIPETISFDKSGEATQRGVGIPSLRASVRRLFLSLVILLTATLSFGVGRLTSPGAGQGIKIEYDPSLTATPSSLSASAASSLSTPSTSSGAEVVGSKNGTKYHYPHCPGAKQIKEANKITFASAAAAESAGYTLAANCQMR